MRRWALVPIGVVLSILNGVVLGAGPHGSSGQHHATPAPSSRMARTQVATEAPDLVLTDQDGRRFAFRDLRGKAVLMSFIYTSCPDVCPVMFNVVTEVQRRVQAEGRGDVVSVFVTTDPEVDSPQVMKTFALRRGADLATTTMLTGNPDEVRAVWSAFGVKVNRRARGLVDHSPLTVLVDVRGVIRYRYLSGFPDADIVAADVRNVLKSRAAK